MTREDLRGIVEGITDEQLKKILDIHSADIGKAKTDRDALAQQLSALQGHSEEMENELNQLRQGQCEAESMKTKIEELQKVIDQKNKAEANREAESILSQRFELVSGGKDFVNELTRKGLFEEFKAAVADRENLGKSDTDLYQNLISERENLFAPEGGIPTILGSAMGFGSDLSQGDVREIMGLQ